VTTTDPRGTGSLRQAFAAANRRPDRSTISFARSLRGAIHLPHHGSLRATEPIRIIGRSYGVKGTDKFGKVAIEGPRFGGKLVLDGDRHGLNTELKGLFLDRVSIAGEDYSLKLSDSYLDGRRTVKARDGVTTFGGGHLAVAGSTVAGFDSGIRWPEGKAAVSDSQIRDNLGPGFLAEATDFRITSSTISGNDSVGIAAVGLGDGYYSRGQVVNSTISGNRAGPYYSGGIYGDVDVNETTIVGNRGGLGGISSGPGPGDLEIRNSIVFGNATTGSGGGDCGSDVTSQGGNLVGSPDGCAPVTTDRVGSDPLLGPLRNNGGSTPTMAIAAGSPAIGLAVPESASPHDQRGVRRDGEPDAGAFERTAGLGR
jgi:hypothetical protein